MNYQGSKRVVVVMLSLSISYLFPPLLLIPSFCLSLLLVVGLSLAPFPSVVRVVDRSIVVILS